MSSTETKRERKRLARTLLKDLYCSTAAKSTMERDEIILLKDLPPVLAVYGEKLEMIELLSRQRKQRAHYLRHLHLARAFLKGVPYEAVEQYPQLFNSGWLSPDAQYIADIINGQCALAESVTTAETSWWLQEHILYQGLLRMRAYFAANRLGRLDSARCESGRAA